MQAFDAPVMQTNCEARPSSTVATQSLMLMNGEFLLGQANRLADRAQGEPAADLPAELIADLPQRWEATPAVWQFGYGSCDSQSGRTASFTPLPHWAESSWQGSANLPDENIGWVFLRADGGHPGDAEHCAIRRWTAPADGVLRVGGTLGHGSDNGDGVRGRVVSSSAGIVGQWPARNGEVPTSIEQLAVNRGDTVDFVTDCVEHVTSDSFTWQVELVLARDGRTVATWKSVDGFHGPASESPSLDIGSIVRTWQLAYLRPPSRDELTAAATFLGTQRDYLQLHPEHVAAGRSPETQALANLSHALLSSNEFLYVD
jgi:hypothetical protein